MKTQSKMLVTSVLTSLWAIQKWMRTQESFKFFSSSILIVYDARKLCQILEEKKLLSKKLPSTAEINEDTTNSGGSSGGEFVGENNVSKGQPKSTYKKIQRSHSSTNNYEQEMRKMKLNYHQMLDNLVGTYDGKREWVNVKMIDFAHTFASSECSTDEQTVEVDQNYLNGIDNLVSIFEKFLKMCE